MRMRSSLIPLILALGVSVVVSVSHAQRMLAWTYEDLTAKSDFVVIAIPITSKDTKERIDLPGIFTQTPGQNQTGVPVIGVETRFAVSVVLKGSKETREFALHHYRLVTPELFQEKSEADGTIRVSLGPGPHLVAFPPGERQAYLMFIVREQDGRYAPTSGQTNPGVYSIHRLEGREPTPEFSQRAEDAGPILSPFDLPAAQPQQEDLDQIMLLPELSERALLPTTDVVSKMLIPKLEPARVARNATGRLAEVWHRQAVGSVISKGRS